MPDFENDMSRQYSVSMTTGRASFGRIIITILRSGMWDKGGAFTLGDGVFCFFLLVRKSRKEKSCARAMARKCAVIGFMAYCPYILGEEFGWLWRKQGSHHWYLTS